ncbi:MAG: peptide deformylase, partial [Dictyoglomus sp.]
EILEREGESIEYEGCLSVPGIEVPVKRAQSIVFKAQDINGRVKKYRAKGLFSRVIQHEIDHLDGVLIVDKAVEEPLQVEK